MRGDQHAYFSLLSGVIVFSPMILAPDAGVIALLFAGIFIGSLAPDADAADSAIMHGLSGGRGAGRMIRRPTVLFLPLFGYTIRYLIYYPVSAVTWVLTLGRVKPRHRGLLHSFFGVIITTLLVISYLWALFSFGFGMNLINHILILAFGFFCGCVMHLVEDSCTHSGVFWLYPFSKRKVSGTVVPKSKRNHMFGLILCAGVILSLSWDTIIYAGYQISKAAPFLIFLVSWTLILSLSGAHTD
ncbi:metal-dependent hydrolase [Methanoplanus sp. FWC-SCC4]|uniref:Metal-dependent hydrolase n=1 Tax=Methanochimaera problematica TaxID=2609417 RepID=A0AA97I414_9EURY|nr:metal-dependent hydrolase [Methanoplanus sp. FWC-SCC4]WOF17248.1 metal-dependent hydrolase [Methanoplanus sp. FWC-SCC4]